MRKLLVVVLRLLFLPLMAVASSRAAILPSYDNYKNWLIACDNGLRCEARGMSDKSSDAHISIIREAGPEGYLRVTVAAPFHFEPVDLVLDNVELELDDTVSVQRHTSRTQLIITAGQAHTFIQQIRDGKFLEFRYHQNRIPLAGLTAALLRMDERQQRLGTQSAFVRRGNALASTVALPPAIPRIGKNKPAPELSPEEHEELLDTVQQFHADPLDSYCYGAMHLMTPIRAQAWPMDERHALVAVPCTLTNIRQVQSFVYIVDRAQDGRIELFQPELGLAMQGRPESHTTKFHALSEPDFDPLTGRLFVSRKQLSNGVCGHAGVWQWQGDGFALVRFTFQNRCGGSTPGDWPVIYRSEVDTQ